MVNWGGIDAFLSALFRNLWREGFPTESGQSKTLSVSEIYKKPNIQNHSFL
jgi:hypothetical protein